MSGRSPQFCGLVGAPGIVAALGTCDGLSVRPVGQAGFPAIRLAGGSIARGFGDPDNGAAPFVAERGQSVAAVTEETTGRIRDALASDPEPDFLIIARTDALLGAGFEQMANFVDLRAAQAFENDFLSEGRPA